MPEQFRIYEFRTPNNNGGSDFKDKVVDYLPKIGFFLIALLVISVFTNLISKPFETLILYPIFIMSLVLHELSHAYMADFLGDPTPRLTGRLTLNPLKHLDLFGTLLFLFCRFGWAKPVQVDASNFRKPDRAMVSVAMAGPLCNFILAIIATTILKLSLPYLNDKTFLLYFYLICYYTASINIMLAVFNLIPIPPLDGSRLVHYLLPAQYKAKYYQFSQQYAFIIIILVFMYAGRMIAPIASQLINSLFMLFRLPILF